MSGTPHSPSPARIVLLDAMVSIPPGDACRPRARTDVRGHRFAALCAGLVALALCGAVPANSISIVDDLFIGVWSPFGTRWEAEARVCVQGDESFRVTATSVGGEAFALRDGALSEVPYDVLWHRHDAVGDGERLDPDVPSRSAIAGAALLDCGGGSNARVQVRVGRLAIESAVPGIYGDTLLLTLSPL